MNDERQGGDEKRWRIEGWRVVLLAIFGCFALMLLLGGQDRVFGWYGYGVLSPDFEDARSVTSAIEYLREGGEPWIENPRDPWERPFNYPRVWLHLEHLGIDQSDTGLFAAVMTLLFFSGVLVFPPADTRPLEVAGLLIVVLSPAAILGVKAGNIDQAMFFLLALAIPGLASQHLVGRFLGVSAIFAGFLLKIFPIFGLAGCALFGRRKLLMVAGAGMALVGIYVAIHWESLQLIREATPVGTRISYGKDVVSLRTAEEFPGLFGLMRAMTWVGVAIGLGLLTLGIARGKFLWAHAGINARAEIAFLVGAGVYCGTFLLGSNWDYRLMFLGFTVPFLLRLARVEGTRWMAVTVLVTMAGVCWNTGVWRLLQPFPGGGPVSVVIDLVCEWCLFFGLMFLAGGGLGSCLKIGVLVPDDRSLGPSGRGERARSTAATRIAME